MPALHPFAWPLVFSIGLVILAALLLIALVIADLVEGRPGRESRRPAADRAASTEPADSLPATKRGAAPGRGYGRTQEPQREGRPNSTPPSVASPPSRLPKPRR